VEVGRAERLENRPIVAPAGSALRSLNKC